MSKKVLYTYPSHEKGMEKVRSEVDEVKVLREETPFEISDEEFKEEIRDADALVNVRTTPTSRDVIEAGEKLKIIARHGVGYSCVDVDAATDSDVIVTLALEQGAHTIAEHVIGLFFALARKFRQSTESIVSGEWNPSEGTGVELKNKTVGIIGVGRIGSSVGEIAKCLGMEVMAFDPYISKERADEMGIELVGLESLLNKSHYISLHVPLTDETRGMIGADEFDRMRNEAYFVNCSRGGIIDEEFLYKALVEGKIAGAGLDVLSSEPPEKSNPLFELENVVFTPHTAGVTEESLERMADSAAESVIRVLRGDLPKIENIVNKSVLRNSFWRERLTSYCLDEILGE